MTNKSKKDKIKQGNQRDFDLFYDVLVSGGTYSDYRSELLDRSMPQERLNYDISEDDILAAWILGKDEESELYAKGGHIHQGLNSNLYRQQFGGTWDHPHFNSTTTPGVDTGLQGSANNFSNNLGAYTLIISGVADVIGNSVGAARDIDYGKYDAYLNLIGSYNPGFSTDTSFMMNEWNQMPQFTNVSYEDAGGHSGELVATNVGKSMLSGAAAGAALGSVVPVIGTAIGAVGGALFGGISQGIGEWRNSVNAKQNQDYINTIGSINAKLNPIKFGYASTQANKLGILNQLSQPYMAACGGKMKNRLASGGYINSHYDYITDPLVKVDAGGTHQENPNEGVLTSIAPDGQPNLVEEGETIINNGLEDAYVFSDRIVADDEILKSHLLPNKFAGKTYADISKELDKIIEEHKNDEISKRTFDEMISRLQQAQEDQKFQEKQEEVEKFLDGLTDEQKEQLEQTMVEEAQAEQQSVEEQAIAKQQSQELAAQEQQMQPEQSPEQVVMEQPEELIVPSRYDQMMSRALFADAANQGMFQLGGFTNRLKKSMTTSVHPQIVYWDLVINKSPLFTGFGGSDNFGGSGASGEWGDTDYIKNEPIPAVTRSFNEAFAEARRNGLDTFRFNGKLYSTEIDPNYRGPGKKEVELMTPPMNIRKVYDNTGVELQDSTRVEPYFGQPIGWTERETIGDKTKLEYIGSEPDWDNKKSKGGHINLPGGKLDLSRYESVKALYDLAYNNRYGNNRDYYNYPGFTDDYILQLRAIDKFNTEDTFKILYKDLYPYLNTKFVETVAPPQVNFNDLASSIWSSYETSPRTSTSSIVRLNSTYEIPSYNSYSQDDLLLGNILSYDKNKKGITTGLSGITGFPNIGRNRNNSGAKQNNTTNQQTSVPTLTNSYSNPHRPDYSIFGQYIPGLTPYEVDGNVLGYTDPLGKFVPIGGESNFGSIISSGSNSLDNSNTTITNSSAKHDEDKDGSVKSSIDYSTWLRYAPAIGSGIQYLSDLFGVTNRNDFSNADMYQKSINNIPSVGFTPLGNYMTYSPLDETYQQNVARSQYNAARRAIQNNASGNASAALAAMDSLNGNMNNTFGDLALQSRQYNDKQREAVEQFNANIARINSMMSLSAQEKNQAIAAEKARLTYQLASMREGIQNMNDAAKSQNETNFYQNLGNIGRENYIMNLINNNLAYYYRDNGDGTYSYKFGLTNAEREAAEKYAKENGLTIK